MNVGLVLTALALGIRHGVDWDHIAAIADLSGAAESRRRGFLLSLLYALGHAAVVLALGTAAILLGTQIPDALDDWMGRLVGMTLVALGGWVIVGLVRHGREFRLQSRWILILDGTFAGLRKVRTRRSARSITVEHDHDHPHEDEAHTESFAHDHAHVIAESHVPAEIVGRPVGRGPWLRRHRHAHRHDLVLPESASAGYHGRTATGIGILHGIGVESPTQIAVFVASTSVVGAWAGLGLLLTWVVGLVVANCVLALLAGAGILHAERNFALYATLAVFVGVMSIVMGAMFIVGID
jgi:cytochrome c biogenesis protein CcdA